MAKSQLCKRVWFDGKGKETRSPRPDTVKGEFRFTNGETLTVTLSDVGEAVAAALPWMGLSEKLQNAMASAKGDVTVAADNCVAMWERLKLGEWVAERESAGPRISVLAEAILRAKTAVGIKDTIETIQTRLKENKELRDRALERPEIKAAFEAIEAERAAERAEKAAAAAGDVKKGESKEELTAF